MPNIVHYEKLIQEKRRKTPFRDFVKELASWDVLNLYRRNGKISRYPENDRIKKLGENFWEDAYTFWDDYNFSKDFFQNFKELQDTIPMQYTLSFWTNENCEYMDGVFIGKNVYLSFIIGFWAENVMYSAFCYDNVNSVMNSFLACKNSSEIAYSLSVTESYKVFYSKNIANSSNIWFSTNLIGCHDCIWCDNLENTQFAINNTVLQKEEYEKNRDKILHDKENYIKTWGHIHKRAITNFASENVSGMGINKSENIENGLWISKMRNARNIAIGNGGDGCSHMLDCMDVGLWSTHYYAVMGAWGIGTHDIYCALQMANNSNCYYSQYLESCHHCLGCIWLKNKSYCILNKQYTKEEWEVLAEKIFASMEADGTLWDFFPASMCPFYFNDTLAYLIDDSFTKEEVVADGYLWRDEPIRADIPEWARIISTKDMRQFEGFDSTRKWRIDPEVMKVVISDEKWNYYRIVQMEYDFLMKHGLPLPRMHWLDRMKMGFQI